MLSIIAVLLKGEQAFNNFYVYRGAFYHMLESKNLYDAYPAEYNDLYHYGPLFSLLIAPFTFLPVRVGIFCWSLFNVWFLWFAIRSLPVSFMARQCILLICLIELQTSLHNLQFNPIVAAWIILPFSYIIKDKIAKGVFYILAGFLTKVYGVAAFVTFFFTKRKGRFILLSFLLLSVLAILPAAISSPAFLLESMQDWYYSLQGKTVATAGLTLSGGMQDISVIGIIRRIFAKPDFSSSWVLVPAGVMAIIPLILARGDFSKKFQLNYLAFILITVVIFSTAAESPTYIIALAGVGIWYALSPAPGNKTNIGLLAFALLLTSLSSTDLFPQFVRKEYITKYSLKALPCFFIWVSIWWRLSFSAGLNKNVRRSFRIGGI